MELVKRADLGTTVDNATAKLTATLDSINVLYTQLDFQEILKNGSRQVSFQFPLGPTLIAQTTSSSVLSSFVPLAAALAAGNPAVVLSSVASNRTKLVLTEAIAVNLDREAVHFKKDNNNSVHRIPTQLPYVVAVLHDLTTSRSLGL